MEPEQKNPISEIDPTQSTYISALEERRWLRAWNVRAEF